jgi:hypothetical protein
VRTIFILVVLCAFGCSQTEQPTPTDTPAVQDAPSETLDNLVYVDMFAPDYTTQHPLIGRAAGGRDMAFRHIQSGETIHTVFPKGVSLPEAFEGQFVLHGQYQTVPPQREDGRLIKRIPKDYRYFAVSSWKQNK